jgi:hypothetical protein
MANMNLLPIKVVLPSQDDFREPNEKGGGFDPLCPVDDEFRKTYVGQVEKVARTFSKSLASGLPAVAKVVLKEEARAKSFRPSEVFNDDTCPIIGVSEAGTLFVSATSAGLTKLEQRLQTADSQTAVAHLSTLSAISPYTATDALGVAPAKDVQTPTNEGQEVLRVKLFRHGNKSLDAQIDAEFERFAKENGASEVKAVNYGRGVKMYRCATKNEPDTAARLASFVGTQSVCKMPRFQMVRTTARALGPVSAENFPAPDIGYEYPVVGLFDSGTDRDNDSVQKWVVKRHDWHPPEEQDNGHGTFVAALIANGRKLNHGDTRFPNASCKIVDVVVFDKSGQAEESDLLAFFEQGLIDFPEVKVWNLSLALMGVPCDSNSMSEFGAAIDDMQQRFGVLFVNAAGNMNAPPYRAWPVAPSFVGQDRLAPPGDGMLCITVGGIAHTDNPAACVRREQPSPFGLRGPALGGIPKPDVCHYAGNCDASGNYMQTGIVSVGLNGQLHEDIGVSFATPLVTAIAGTVDRELRVNDEPMSSLLVKGLIVHSALVKNGPPLSETIEYTGYGIPAEPEEILHCTQSAATIIFQVPVTRIPRFYKHPFAMPDCLAVSGNLKCDLFATLIYDSPLDRAFGVEYCRRNVEASLGFLVEEEERGEVYGGREVHPCPHDLHQRYPAQLSHFGLQWSPMKLYFRRFKKTAAGRKWRLSLKVTNRAECDIEEPMDVHLIVTIKSHDPDAQVYTEMVREMDRLGWTVGNLEIRSRERQQER